MNSPLFMIRGRLQSILLLFLYISMSLCLSGLSPLAMAQTTQGEIEDRASPVARRFCIAGTSSGNRCNQNSDCPGSTCTDRNVFTIQTAVHYNASAADLTAIQNMITAGSAVIFDVTDGQAEIGQAIIHNNALGTSEADLRVYPGTCTSGTSIGTACTANSDCPPNTNPGAGACGVWWWASTGSYRNSGSMNVSINNINSATTPGNLMAHEFVHLVFDARDEYESRPSCSTTTGNANCPAAGSGLTECLMDSNGAELCWGQGITGDLTSVVNGNHDAANVTEQSSCRSNRSCWDQIAWSWPDTILMPGGAPDPAANGKTVNATNFVVTSDTVRVVLVLDESGSMDLETPKRIDRLKVAARDFITLAENGAEVGIVSYATDASTASGHAGLTIAALGNNRSNWTNAINGLSATTRTNIGDGLQKAKDMIVAAGGVTANTFIVLMTDGVNNEPWPQSNADSDLNAKVADLLASNIPVYVTCTGSDLGVDSQCAEIASGTSGFYVDSADAAQLPEAFVDFHERITGHDAIDSVNGTFQKIGAYSPKIIYVDEGSRAVTFTLQWAEQTARASLVVIDPDGNSHQSQSMSQGRFVKVKNPGPGDWQIVIDPSGGADSTFVSRAYTQHPTSILSAAVRHPSVKPGEDIYVYAYPRNLGRPITLDTGKITALVTLPDGSQEMMELLDQGRNASGEGDDMPGDGIFTGVYTNTAGKGAYQFLIKADMQGWELSHDAHEYEFDETRSRRFVREVRLSAAVADPSDVVKDPEDDHHTGRPPQGGENGDPTDSDTIKTILVIILVLLVVLIIILLMCCRRRTDGVTHLK